MSYKLFFLYVFLNKEAEQCCIFKEFELGSRFGTNTTGDFIFFIIIIFFVGVGAGGATDSSKSVDLVLYVLCVALRLLVAVSFSCYDLFFVAFLYSCIQLILSSIVVTLLGKGELFVLFFIGL